MTEELDRVAIRGEERHSRRRVGTKKKKPRKQRIPSEEGEDEVEEGEEGSFPTWKTGAVIAVIIGCFAILYPKMFHPMLMFVLGFNKKESEPEQKFPHPSMRSSGPMPGKPGFGPDPHIHAGHGGPHPGMRMAAQMGNQQATHGGGGKGMWHWMLPFYTVGVIIFLLYTLSKILWKTPKKKSRKYHYNTGRQRFEVDGEEVEASEETESEEEEPGKGKLNNKELKGLQNRLTQTESAMQRILEQLETISGTVDQGTADSVKKMTLDTLNSFAKTEASEIVDDVSRGTQRTKKKNEESGYLEDLEKALSDFKKFTDNYVQQHGGAAASSEDRAALAEMEPADMEDEPEEVEDEEEVSELSEEEDEDEEEEDGSGESDKEDQQNPDFDRMESEDPDNLEVPEPTGEIIPVDESGVAHANPTAVRKRPRKT